MSLISKSNDDQLFKINRVNVSFWFYIIAFSQTLALEAFCNVKLQNDHLNCHLIFHLSPPSRNKTVNLTITI